jgi:hypothetical protein
MNPVGNPIELRGLRGCAQRNRDQLASSVEWLRVDPVRF